MPNKPTIVRTNSTPNSVKLVKLKIITFQELWDNYPSGNPYDNPTYTNQCAIRMSVTFHRLGIEMKSFSDKVIKPLPGKKDIGRIILDGKATATRANELGEWLKLQPIAALGKPQDVTGENWISRVKGRTGIVMFDGYWTRDGESSADASGGHIDKWNRDTLTPSAESFMRFRMGVSHLPNPLSWLRGRNENAYSDLSKSKKILFWTLSEALCSSYFWIVLGTLFDVGFVTFLEQRSLACFASFHDRMLGYGTL